jgi:hypothetical protein
MFILLLFFIDIFRFPSLRKLLNQLEKTRQILGKLLGDIILGSSEERQVLMSKSI